MKLAGFLLSIGAFFIVACGGMQDPANQGEKQTAAEQSEIKQSPLPYICTRTIVEPQSGIFTTREECRTGPGTQAPWVATDFTSCYKYTGFQGTTPKLQCERSCNRIEGSSPDITYKCKPFIPGI